jgi:hypothetical protein
VPWLRTTGDPQTAGRIERKETAMTRRIRLWITAVLTVAATALMVGLTITAQAGVTHTHPSPSLAGIIFNSIDQAAGTGAAAIRGARALADCRMDGQVWPRSRVRSSAQAVR